LPRSQAPYVFPQWTLVRTKGTHVTPSKPPTPRVGAPRGPRSRAGATRAHPHRRVPDHDDLALRLADRIVEVIAREAAARDAACSASRREARRWHLSGADPPPPGRRVDFSRSRDVQSPTSTTRCRGQPPAIGATCGRSVRARQHPPRAGAHPRRRRARETLAEALRRVRAAIVEAGGIASRCLESARADTSASTAGVIRPTSGPVS